MLEPLRASKMSGAELKDEVIKDLENQTAKKDNSKSKLIRNVSQLSNYFERKMSNSRLVKNNTNTSHSYLSEMSSKKARDTREKNNKITRVNS